MSHHWILELALLGIGSKLNLMLLPTLTMHLLQYKVNWILMLFIAAHQETPRNFKIINIKGSVAQMYLH